MKYSFWSLKIKIILKQAGASSKRKKKKSTNDSYLGRNRKIKQTFVVTDISDFRFSVHVSSTVTNKSLLLDRKVVAKFFFFPVLKIFLMVANLHRLCFLPFSEALNLICISTLCLLLKISEYHNHDYRKWWKIVKNCRKLLYFIKTFIRLPCIIFESEFNFAEYLEHYHFRQVRNGYCYSICF